MALLTIVPSKAIAKSFCNLMLLSIRVKKRQARSNVNNHYKKINIYKFYNHIVGRAITIW